MEGGFGPEQMWWTWVKVDTLDIYEDGQNSARIWTSGEGEGIVNMVKTKFVCPVIKVQNCHVNSGSWPGLERFPNKIFMFLSSWSTWIQ